MVLTQVEFTMIEKLVVQCIETGISEKVWQSALLSWVQSKVIVHVLLYVARKRNQWNAIKRIEKYKKKQAKWPDVCTFPTGNQLIIQISINQSINQSIDQTIKQSIIKITFNYEFVKGYMYA